jgi:hypothetical protein
MELTTDEKLKILKDRTNSLYMSSRTMADKIYSQNMLDRVIDIEKVLIDIRGEIIDNMDSD